MTTSNDRGGEAEVSSTCSDWPVTDLNKFRRAMCLGVESYLYTCADTEQLQEMNCVNRLLENNQGPEVVREIVDFSINGRTAKQQALLLALAICARSTDLKTKKAAYNALPDVCRIPTHLFLFVNFIEELSSHSSPTSSTGWGRALRRAISSWYLTQQPKDLALFVTKYKQRNGWSHKDLLRLSHTNPENNQAIALILKYVTRGWKKTKEGYADDGLPAELKSLLTYLEAVETVKHASIEEGKKVAALIEEHHLVREHVPTWLLKSKEVWRALLQHMPTEALIKSLNKLSSLELLSDDSEDNCIQLVIDRLHDSEQLQKSRLHPINILLALERYKMGTGNKSKKLKWKPNPAVTDALNHAFYAAFKNIQPTEKKYLICIDLSTSMEYVTLHECSDLTPRTVAAAMSMVFVRTERHCTLMAFSSSGLTPVTVTPEMTIEEVCKMFSEIKKGSKDFAVPFSWALENKKEVDVFILYTDSKPKSWPVKTSPADSLRKYRKEMNIENARLIVCSLTASTSTMADPNDAGMLDIAGFDSAVPQIIQNFVLGRL